MHLVESYSGTTRLKISTAKLQEQFFPLEFEKYIIVVSGTGMGGKNYRYFTDVLKLLKPYLEKDNIKVIQTGGDKEYPITGTDLDLRGKTNIYQLNYLVRNSLLTLSGDTSVLHIAGIYDIPLVSLYGLTNPEVSGAYFGDKKKQTYLEPDREKCPPSFNPNDDCVNRIPPEKVVNSCLSSLNINHNLNIETINMGMNYHNLTVEVVPDMVLNNDFVQGMIINIRGDYHFNEQNIYNQIHVRKSTLIIKNPLNLDILKKLKNNIHAIIYEIDENTDLGFIKNLHNSGIPYNLITNLSEEKLNKIKPLYFDYALINPQNNPSKKESVPNFEKFNNTTKFRTNRFLLSEGKAFLSKAHWLNKISSTGFEENSADLLDQPEFWENSPYFWFFNQK